MGDGRLKLLLDTHVWVWSQEEPDRLGPHAKRLLVGAQHENHVCTVSILEIARQIAAGRIRMSIRLSEWLDCSLRALGARTVDVSHEIAMEAYALPGRFHKDPADRLLVAAARCLDLTVLTADVRILAYRGASSRDARR